MLSLLRDFLWWCGARGWRALRVMSGDDAYEQHLALVQAQADARVPAAGPTRRDRRAIYDRELDRKWSRYTACGRCFDR